MASLLRNSDFEEDWSTENSHQCLKISGDGELELVDLGEIFTPPGWIVWYRLQEEEWGKPEGREATGTNPPRMKSGDKGYLLFTFNRKMDAGLLQQVKIKPGTRLRFTMWAHAWSNNKDDASPGRFPYPDEPLWSEGAGGDPFFEQEGKLSGYDKESDLRNFTFWIGIDPFGGLDPFAGSVVWGTGAHIYNAFAQVPTVEATAQSDNVTVFTRARTEYAFTHNDAYWDAARLMSINESLIPAEDRGKPRIQYERYYVLLPPGANKEWATAVIEATWDDNRYTVGGSADDAGIGNLDSRIVLAINPELWGGEQLLKEFFAEHYPGVRFRSVKARTPEELVALLKE